MGIVQSLTNGLSDREANDALTANVRNTHCTTSNAANITVGSLSELGSVYGGATLLNMAAFSPSLSKHRSIQGSKILISVSTLRIAVASVMYYCSSSQYYSINANKWYP